MKEDGKAGMSSVQKDRQSESEGKWRNNNMPTMYGGWRTPTPACNRGKRNEPGSILLGVFMRDQKAWHDAPLRTSLKP